MHQQAIEEHEIQIHHCKLRTWSLLHTRLLVLVALGAGAVDIGSFGEIAIPLLACSVPCCCIQFHVCCIHHTCEKLLTISSITSSTALALTQQHRARNEEVKQRYTPSTALLLRLRLPMANKGNEEVSPSRKKRCVQARDQRDDASRPTNKQGADRVTGMCNRSKPTRNRERDGAATTNSQQRTRGTRRGLEECEMQTRGARGISGQVRRREHESSSVMLKVVCLVLPCCCLLAPLSPAVFVMYGRDPNP